MQTFEVLKTRKSVRSYTGEAITEEQLKAVLQAGQASPVGMGRYETLQMTVIRDKEMLEKIDRNAAEFMGDLSRKPLYKAPCLILVSSVMEDPKRSNVVYSNAAMMVHNMALAATELKVGSCCIWGAIGALNTKPEMVAELNLPQGHVPCCGLILGVTEEVLEERNIPEDRVKVVYMD